MNEMLYFEELNEADEMNTQGGGEIFWVLVGVGVGWFIDGLLDAKTGKTGSDFVSDAISSASPGLPNNGGYNSSGSKGGTSSAGRSHSSGGYIL